MTLLVRNEEDIIEANIRYHLAQGVDFIIATDNCSVDKTPQILQYYQRAGKLLLINEPEDTYSQAVWVTRMARLAATKYKADWILNNDADEFWWPIKGNLKSFLAQVPNNIGVIRCKRHNFIPRPFNAQPFYQRMIYREIESLNENGKPLPAKILHRANANITITQGNHWAHGLEHLIEEEINDIRIFHFPLRSYSHFESKIKNGGQAYLQNKKLDPSVGATWRALYLKYQENKLSEVYKTHELSEQILLKKRLQGEILVDRRLEYFLRLELNKEIHIAPQKPHLLNFINKIHFKNSKKQAAIKHSFFANRGVVTLADENYFLGVELLYQSIQDCYQVPLLVFDGGMTPQQIDYLRNNYPQIIISPLPDIPEIALIKNKLDSSSSFSKVRQIKCAWRLWICPFLIAHSPFRRTVWLDADIVVLRNFEQLFQELDKGPLFTPENLAPDRTMNLAELYKFLPLPNGRLPLESVLINAGVSAWDLERDSAALQAYMHPVLKACKDESIRNAIAWHDQGCLIWAINFQDLSRHIANDWRWNCCVRNTPAFGKNYIWDENLFAQLRQDVPDVNILHWNGTKAPWHFIKKTEQHLLKNA